MNRQPLTALLIAMRFPHPKAIRLQPSWQWAARLLLMLILPAPMAHAQETGRIDFRNFIPGELDAPVYEADGVTRLEGNRYSAKLTAVCLPSAPEGIDGETALSPFQTGDLAGYWQPQIVNVGCPPGVRAWAQVRILDQPPGLDGTPTLVRALTQLFAVELRSEPVALSNLGPIILNPFPAVVEFRNQIPGVLDAPVHEFDGVTRLAGTNYSVQLHVDLTGFDESGPRALERIGSSYFDTGDRAGYWVPKRFAVHGRLRDGYPGERVWARIKVYDRAGQVLQGASEPFRLDLKPSTTLLGLKTFSLNKAPPGIDFRNYIAGVLDAPVYRADGTTRLSGTTSSYAALFIGTGPEPYYMSPLVTAVPRLFGSGERAGYLWAGDIPTPEVIPFATYGDRVWVQIRVWEPHQSGHIPEVLPPFRFSGESEVFSLVLTNELTPLIGLKSFRLKPAPIRVSQQGGQLVLRWSAGDGTVNYDLEEASVLDRPDAWRPSSTRPVLVRQDSERTWVADWVVTNGLTRPAAYYRIRLLNP